MNKNELCLLARLKKFFWTITRGKLSDPSALDCAVNRILIAVLGIKHEYLEYFEGRCMKPITERTKGPLKNLRAVLALWVNDEEMVDRHCKIIGSKEQKLVESKLNRDRGETSPTSLSPKKVNTFGASNQFHPFHYQQHSFSGMLLLSTEEAREVETREVREAVQGVAGSARSGRYSSRGYCRVLDCQDEDVGTNTAIEGIHDNKGGGSGARVSSFDREKRMKNRFLTSFAGLDPEAQDNVLIFFTKLITERAQHQSYMHLPTTARMASPTTRQHSSHTNLLFA